MSSTASSTPCLTPSPSPTPRYPVQPDHFYGPEGQPVRVPNAYGRPWLDPEDDPLAQRGIPVFKPTMDEFKDFEAYMNRVECWGMRSGIVKVIPPEEWTDALPDVTPQLANVKLKSPIEQQMMGHGGLFRQQNIERRKVMSVREWAELCAKEEMRAPGVKDIGLHARATNGAVRAKTRRTRTKTTEPESAEVLMTPEVVVKEEDDDSENAHHGQEQASTTPRLSPSRETAEPAPVSSTDGPPAATDHGRLSVAPSVADSGTHESRPATPEVEHEHVGDDLPKPKGRRKPQTKESREAALALRADKDKVFLSQFRPHQDWLPPNTSNDDYNHDFCKELERRYWRHCGLGKSAWYGADMAGSLFTDETKSWNVAHLESALTRLLPASDKGLPGVNTPYLYFGMWRATFAWHVEDMDLFSINYIHFGAPKFWYAVPQGRASALEQAMKGYFPKEPSHCPQFLRHKSFLASPKLLSQSSVNTNYLVQREGEFVITYPRGYHAGFNLGFNCAESVNFALNSWLAMGRAAKICQCVDFSVRIDVDQLLRDRETERAVAEAAAVAPAPATEADIAQPSDDSTVGPEQKPPRKRKPAADGAEGSPKSKKPRTKEKAAKNENTSVTPPSPSKPPKVTLKLGPKPAESDLFPCCLCVSISRDGLLRVHNPPLWQKQGESGEGSSSTAEWYAHEECANVIPETWVDDFEVGPALPDGTQMKERMVFGTDGIPKDRWNLKCNACTKTRQRAHGAPIQCTKGKCPKAYHVSCARTGTEGGISYRVLREVENDVLLNDPRQPAAGDAVPGGVDNAQVLSLVKKLEVEVLCPQHNPAMMEAKKAARQDKIRSALVALPPMARIKLRVSAGVFEVTLVRVIEDTGCVEVLWDRGHKREFKWSSVVFGTSDTVVGQKPTEAAPEPPARPSAPVAPSPAASQPSSFYLPLGPAARSEPRPTSQTPTGHPTQYPSIPPPATSAALPSSQSSHYYRPNYYPPHTATSQQPSNYYSGTWQYQYPNHSNNARPYSTPQTPYPSSTPYLPVQYPPSSTAPSAPPNAYGYAQSYAPNYGYGPAAGTYTRQPQQQAAAAEHSPVAVTVPASAQAHTRAAQPPPHAQLPYTPAQQPAYTQPYQPPTHVARPKGATEEHLQPLPTPAAVSGASYMHAPTAQVPYSTANHYRSNHSSRSHTPYMQMQTELRWQEPYQGPKATSSAGSSARGSRAPSVDVQARSTPGAMSGSPSPYPPHAPAPAAVAV